MTPRAEVDYLGWPRPITSLQLFDDFKNKDYILFHTTELYSLPEEYLRGITLSADVGDCVYKFIGSDVAIVIKYLSGGFVPVGWAITGVGEGWQPTKDTMRRLECLHRRALPTAEDWHCRRWEEGKLDINEVIAEEEFPGEAIEKRAVRWTWSRIWLDVDYCVAVSIIEGYIRPPPSHLRWREDTSEPVRYLLRRLGLRCLGLRGLYWNMREDLSDFYCSWNEWLHATWLWNFSVLPVIQARYLHTRYQYGVPRNTLYDFSPEQSLQLKAVSIIVTTRSVCSILGSKFRQMIGLYKCADQNGGSDRRSCGGSDENKMEDDSDAASHEDNEVVEIRNFSNYT